MVKHMCDRALPARNPKGGLATFILEHHLALTMHVFWGKLLRQRHTENLSTKATLAIGV